MAVSPPRSSSDVAAARLQEILRGGKADDDWAEQAEVVGDDVDSAAGDTVVPRYRFGLWSVPPRAFLGAALVAVAAVLGLVVYTVTQAPDQRAVPQRALASTAAAESEPAAESDGGAPGPNSSESASAAALPGATAAFVVVHVAGQVATPGVVQVASGSRVADVVDATGGVLPGADLDRVNLARVVTDGEQVLIPAPGQSLPAPSSDSGAPATAGAGAGPAAVVNLNMADAQQLQALPGIGPVLAQRIVQYRQSSGALRSVEELVEVPGIGEKVLGRLRPLVTV